jgi:hypothetical protein
MNHHKSSLIIINHPSLKNPRQIFEKIGGKFSSHRQKIVLSAWGKSCLTASSLARSRPAMAQWTLGAPGGEKLG